MYLALVFALAAALSSLGGLFTEPSWWFVCVGTVGIVVFAIASVRALTRWAWWGPIAGVIALLASLTFSFAADVAIAAVIPTPDVLDRFASLVVQGMASISSQGVPARPVTAIVFLLAAGAGLLAMLLDAVAVMASRPALIGVPLVGLLAVPALFDSGQTDAFPFLLTAGAYLLVLYLSLGERRSSGALGVGAVAIVIALVLPISLPPVSDQKADPVAGSGFAISINTFISLGDRLRQPNPTRVLTYQTTSNDGQYLTVSSIDDFTGDQWQPAEPTGQLFGSLDDFGDVPGLSDGIPIEELTTSVSIVNMGGRFAPVPYSPASVDGLDGKWGINERNLTVVSSGASIRNEKYVVQSVHALPSLQQLRNAGTVVPPDFDRYLEVPDGLPALVSETATDVVGDATTNIDKAIALQSYFTGGEFVYSETAPVMEDYDGTSAEIIGEFLAAKSGYCVHFSSAMAVMARTLDIPARISVGFTPGEYAAADDDGDPFYTVTTSNLHAWPELYFDTIGWVRFEPTVGRGEVPTFSDAPVTPTDPNAPTPTPTTSAAPSATATPTATPSPTPTIDPTDVGAGSLIIAAITVALLALGALVALLVPLLPAAVRITRRLRRYWRIRQRNSAHEAWAELRDTATDLGWQAASATPQEFEQLVGPTMDDEGRQALARLRAAIEFTAFSPRREPARVADVSTVRWSMAQAATRAERIRSRFSPRSVVLRFALPPLRRPRARSGR